MNSKGEIHLNDDQLLRAVVCDAEGLNSTLREHLLKCHLCLAEKERLEQTLVRLGQMAERLTPSPRRKASLKVEKRRSPWWWSLAWGGAVAAAVTVVLTILVVSGSIVVKTKPEESATVLTREMWEDEKFITEIRMLEENPLSPLYLEISGGAYFGFDDGFMKFVVPPLENDTTSYEPKKRGTVPC